MEANKLRNEQTHDIFFKVITKRKLRELLLRSVTGGMLQQQINVLLTNIYSKTEVDKNAADECSIYIKFYMKETHKEIGYLSFHLHPKKGDLSHKNNGRFHGRNTGRNLKYTMRVHKNNDGCITFSLTNSFSYIRLKFETGVNAALAVLNSYFNESSPNWLGRPKFQNAKPHNCYTSILKTMEKRKKTIGNTRKRYNQYSITKSTSQTLLSKQSSE